MDDRRHVLLLGGTSEGFELSQRLSGQFKDEVRVTTSLAGRTVSPALPVGVSRIGGFGGMGGLRDWIVTHQVHCVIDATHPYAVKISENAFSACASVPVPFVRLERPPWDRQSGDVWHDVGDVAEAAALLPRLGRRAFLTIGVKDLSAFSIIQDMFLLCRSIDPPPASEALANIHAITGRGPFSVESETRVLSEFGIDVIVSKNSGGTATEAKITAARNAGLPVIMIQRSPCEISPVVSNVEETIRWMKMTLD